MTTVMVVMLVVVMMAMMVSMMTITALVRRCGDDGAVTVTARFSRMTMKIVMRTMAAMEHARRRRLW